MQSPSNLALVPRSTLHKSSPLLANPQEILMTVHALSTKSAPAEITASEAARRYADYLQAKSYCIDESAWPLKALHIRSNTDSSIDSFRYDFPAFAKSKGIRVEADYSSFLHSLTDRLAYLLPRVKATSFRPEPKQIFTNQYGLKCANTYAPFNPTVPDVFVMPAILEDYLSRVFMNDQDRKYVTQWLADIVQNPTRRPQWAVVLTGKQGSGKSSVFRLLTAALGGRHTWEHNQYAPAFDKFSEVLPDNLLVSFDDAVALHNTYQKLKQNITLCSSGNQGSSKEGNAGSVRTYSDLFQLSPAISNRARRQTPICCGTFRA